MRNKKQFSIQHIPDFSSKALEWANGKDCFCFLNGNDSEYRYKSFPQILATGNYYEKLINTKNTIDNLYKTSDWQFGFIGYDLFSTHNAHFFTPNTLIYFLDNESIEIESTDDPDEIIQSILDFVPAFQPVFNPIEFKVSENKEQYIQKIENLKKHIVRGDIYQINFCIEFEAHNVDIDPINVYKKLNTQSPMPFSGLLKISDKYIICASPERYLKRIGDKFISQPMKGTAPRHADPEIDFKNRNALYNSQKERAENTMIVDLVRNDLARFCKSGTVEVEKLCEIYSFNPVHQMVTTVTGFIDKDFSSEIAIQESFPMGSMTGAPKIRAMELIEKFESSPRRAFSGSLGYIEPNGNFDFNVLIRSIFYDRKAQNVTYNVGSGITALSDPEQEFAECMLKASIIQQVLGNKASE